MFIPRAHSDPGGQRRESRWLPVHPPTPMTQVQPLLRYPQPSLQRHDLIMPHSLQSVTAINPQFQKPQMTSFGVNTEPVGEPVIPHPERKPLCLRILLVPYTLIAWILTSWCSPSPECMRCVQISYWMVIMVSGIITLVLALSPKK